MSSFYGNGNVAKKYEVTKTLRLAVQYRSRLDIIQLALPDNLLDLGTTDSVIKLFTQSTAGRRACGYDVIGAAEHKILTG